MSALMPRPRGAMSSATRDLVFVRHGMNSDRTSMESLCDRLRRVKAPQLEPEIDNSTYRWKEPVLAEGIALARAIIGTYQPLQHRRIVLIGHSQGGLICRVAAAMLAGTCDAVMPGRSTLNDAGFGRVIGDLLATWVGADRAGAAVVGPALAGVIMLGTPNGGAFTFGQLSLVGRPFAAMARQIVSPFGMKNLPDLTTDRLPRLLQHYRVPSVKYLSVSGSAISRYSSVNYDDLASVPLIGRLGARLELPNDSVVEDCSVDLEQAPLPCEIADMATQYEHVRAYVDCTSVAHTAIQSNDTVIAIVKDRMNRWLPAPPLVAAPPP